MDQVKLHNIVNVLVQLPASVENKAEYLEQLKANIDKALELLHPSNELESDIHHFDKITPKFTITSLYALKLLSEFLCDDSPANLMSIQQQQKIKILLQMIFSLGLTPSLFHGVNTSLKNKTIQLYLYNLEKLTVIESYLLMTKVVRSLVQILSAPNLRALILTHLGDLISALLQVIHAGVFKKPVKNSNPENVTTTNKSFVMTEEWYEKLVGDRNEFKIIYQKLVDDIYKPLVIKELLILLAPAKSIENGEPIAPPSWLRRAISYQLTGYLISPGGVSLIMRAMCESSSDIVDWNKAEVMAKLISTVHGNLSEDDFYSKISPQVIAMLNTTGPYCIPVAKNCIKNIYRHNEALCHKYIFNKLFEPFMLCSKTVSENFSGTLVSEDSLSRCIDHLTKCFAVGSKESSIPISVLIKIINILYQLYMKVAKSHYQHKAAISDLIVEFLHSEKDIRSLTSIYGALIFKEPHKEILEVNEDLEFQFGPSGGVQVGKCHRSDTPQFPGSEFQLEFETSGDHMLDLLSCRQEYSKKLLSDLFVILLSSLSEFHDHKIQVSDSNPDILSVDELIVFLVRISQKRMITIKLLAVLSENVYVVETIQEKPEIIFKFVKNLLESKANDVLQNKKRNDAEANTDEEGDDWAEDSKREDAEDLIVVLSVVDLITLNVKVNSERWDTCKSLLPSIEIIRDNCRNCYIKYLSELLHKRINTRGAVSGSKKPQMRTSISEKLLRLNSQSKATGAATEKQKPILNNFDESADEKKKKLIVEVDESNSEDAELNTLLDEVCSEDVPTRGHAIIQLGKLIRKSNPRTLPKKDYIFAFLKCNLNHEDTYIYLSAINALEALATATVPDKILQLLCDEYTENKKKSSELQMKIGEVLMRITRNLNEVAPKYKALLINTFLFGAKNSDELLRVSSLSNLGELLKILGYGVGGIIQEVFKCVRAIATTDKSDMARRAAVMVIQFLLKGVSENSFAVLKFVIRDLYRALLHIYKTDKDEVTRLHAELALAEINRIVQSSVSRPRKLEKHIGILDFPH